MTVFHRTCKGKHQYLDKMRLSNVKLYYQGREDSGIKCRFIISFLFYYSTDNPLPSLNAVRFNRYVAIVFEEQRRKSRWNSRCLSVGTAVKASYIPRHCPATPAAFSHRIPLAYPSASHSRIRPDSTRSASAWDSASRNASRAP